MYRLYLCGSATLSIDAVLVHWIDDETRKSRKTLKGGRSGFSFITDIVFGEWISTIKIFEWLRTDEFLRIMNPEMCSLYFFHQLSYLRFLLHFAITYWLITIFLPMCWDHPSNLWIPFIVTQFLLCKLIKWCVIS